MNVLLKERLCEDEDLRSEFGLRKVAFAAIDLALRQNTSTDNDSDLHRQMREAQGSIWPGTGLARRSAFVMEHGLTVRLLLPRLHCQLSGFRNTSLVRARHGQTVAVCTTRHCGRKISSPRSGHQSCISGLCYASIAVASYVERSLTRYGAEGLIMS